MKPKFNDELLNEFIKSANEVTIAVKVRNYVASDIDSKYNQLKLAFDNHKFNPDLSNI